MATCAKAAKAGLLSAGLLAAGLPVLLAADRPAAAQSFDCGKARTATEKAICDSPPLGFLDSDMARTYEEARHRAGPAGERHVLDSQRAWLKSRDRCGGKADCLIGSYRARLRQIGQMEKIFPGWGGKYETWSGLDITITPRGADYHVQLDGAGATYTCGSQGSGKADSAGTLDVTVGATTVTFAAMGSGILLPDDLDQPSDFAACGAQAPGVGGYYRRLE
ncbi:lysozyme inhibitor LprI family protein [Marinibaculum pumilum]|uniref:Lysozyme inhibitor LprI family protein n=1 Tax=Marinibaculum pumilum TaxID=1766165 RepID=A0ABV7L1C2_9PROT